jgi:hypothetical protein
MKNWIFKDESSGPSDHKAARTRAILLSLPFALLGFFALVLLLHDEVGSGFAMPKQKAIGLLSGFIASGGFIALIFGINAKKMALKTPALKSSDNEKPWLKRADWVAGRLKSTSSSQGAAFFLWVFTIFWNLISAAVIIVVVLPQLHQGNQAALFALIFPVIGAAMLVFAAKTTLAWRRYKKSYFEIAAMPGALGGTLEGMIRVNAKLQPEHGLHLRLSCVRRTTIHAGKNRGVTEKILWQDEKWLRADLPQTDLNATGIPVYFKLPDGQPESTPAGGDGIHWKLEASAKVSGPNFNVSFEVPVFKLAETPVPSDDTSKQYQMSLDEMRKQIHSRIQVSDLPDSGKEFIFPAARNLGFATGATVIWLIWTGVIILLIYKHAPPLLPLVSGAADLLMTIFLINLWFHHSRVVVAAGQVKIETSWSGFKKRRIIKSSDVANFATEVGANVGHSAYYDLKVRTRDRQEFTVAKHLSNKPEADWLVREMIAGLRRPSDTKNSQPPPATV